jgi:16S rRNA (guanine527-N7)-methyltransferase
VTPTTPARPRLPLPSPPRLAPPAGFAERLASIGAGVEDATLGRLGDYLARLLAMNETLNLTAIVQPDEAWERHVLDALTLLPLWNGLWRGARLADVGSGGGVPGIPIAIALPHVEVTLIESIKKKAAFLEDVAAALGLANVRVVAERAEAAAGAGLHGAFDVVTARAVAKTEALVAFTAPLAKPGGRLYFIKGQRADEEVAEAARAMKRAGVAHQATVPTPTGRIVVLERRGGASR